MKVRIEFELPESCRSCPIKCKWYDTNSKYCPLLAYVVPDQSEQQTQPEQPTQNPDFLTITQFLGCTLREIMLEVDSPRVSQYAQGGVAGCPSDYDYFGTGYNCGKGQTRSCTECWDQVYTGYKEAEHTS